MKQIILAASILSADLARLADETKAVVDAGVDAIHFDMMDGHYVPNLTFGPALCAALRKNHIRVPIDVHAMVTNPEDYIESFAKAGATRFTFHPKTVTNPTQTCEKIIKCGMQAGIAINPNESVNIDSDLASLIDLVLIMSVYPGFGGQSFISDSLDKIKETKRLVKDKVHVGIDGGVKLDNIASVVQSGADFVVMGSGIFESDNYAHRVKSIKAQLT